MLGVGCDCLGLLRGVWREVVGPEVLQVPPYSRNSSSGLLTGLSRILTLVEDRADLPVGVVIIFKVAPRHEQRHAGITAGGDAFIHATEIGGVREEQLSAAWRRRIEAVYRYPEGAL